MCCVAFVLLYLLIVLVVCLPVLVAEMVLGRSTGKSPLSAPVQVAGASWQPMGWLFVIAACGILAFYAVLMGWTAHTFFHSLLYGLPANMNEAENFFEQVSSGNFVLLGQFLSLVLTAIIVSGGIRGGIERLTSFCMPLLFFLLIVLTINSTNISGV